MENDLELEIGCGNVFADLNLPDADKLLLKTNLIHTIAELIHRRQLSQTEAAAILKIDQPKVSAIMHSRISGFSVDRLLGFLTLLGHNVHISVDAHETSRASVSVEMR